MSGYCPDCGNTLCVCAEFERQRSEPPDAAGVGPLTCSCGVLTLGPASGWRQSSLVANCPACGDRLEVWPSDD